jgi:hypothetical protein
LVCLNADVLVTVAGLLCEQQASRLEIQSLTGMLFIASHVESFMLFVS